MEEEDLSRLAAAGAGSAQEHSAEEMIQVAIRAAGTPALLFELERRGIYFEEGAVKEEEEEEKKPRKKYVRRAPRQEDVGQPRKTPRKKQPSKWKKEEEKQLLKPSTEEEKLPFKQARSDRRQARGGGVLLAEQQPTRTGHHPLFSRGGAGDSSSDDANCAASYAAVGSSDSSAGWYSLANVALASGCSVKQVGVQFRNGDSCFAKTKIVETFYESMEGGAGARFAFDQSGEARAFEAQMPLGDYCRLHDEMKRRAHGIVWLLDGGCQKSGHAAPTDMRNLALLVAQYSGVATYVAKYAGIPARWDHLDPEKMLGVDTADGLQRFRETLLALIRRRKIENHSLESLRALAPMAQARELLSANAAEAALNVAATTSQ